MLEVKNRFDERRVYAARCPSCKKFMNVPGVTLNTERYIRCRNCKAIGKTMKWVQGGQVCR